ncbi:hypothetical protein AB0E85_28425 [Streptomyces sp. NPDC029044]|uniref:rhamnogalacturonan lyase family protein n=1 Tax=Streptomyces sp. NPDC029044 TaxID=3157198 RepID=UPI0033C025E2
MRTYSTPHQTGTWITALFHDAQYRTTPAWQNSAYNQPSRPGCVVNDDMTTQSSPVVDTP